MKKVLVTGGAGFIGSHLVDELVKKGYEVTVYDSLDPQVHPDGIPDYINLNARYIFEDIRKKQELKKIIKEIDYIFHFAAKVGVGQSQYQIEKYVDVNIKGTANLLDILVNTKNNVKKLIVASSMSIYGEGLYKCEKCGNVKPNLRDFKDEKINDWEPKCPYCKEKITPLPTPETLPLISNSIYAISKKEQEEMSLLIGKTYGIPVVSLRFFNVYGPRQTLSNPYTGVCAIFLSRIKNNNPPVIYEDGLQTRDFIWVGDVVNACILSMEKNEANYQIFNVGSGKPVSILEMAELLIKLLGKDLKPEITYKFRKGDVRHCYADISKIKNKIGFEPQTTLEEGMKKLIEWAKETEAEDKFEKAQEELRKKGLV
ncbi:MAG TPA: SDR family NAD(P)-dependent oxidoreductase [bacterium]|nr:SDR family NAD(P)-dependent oxidoreductase [bacterium]HOM26161.1 SDR family NAD(P)-dependent oxidoreductase [bacterium]